MGVGGWVCGWVNGKRDGEGRWGPGEEGKGKERGGGRAGSLARKIVGDVWCRNIVGSMSGKVFWGVEVSFADQVL